MMTKCLLRGSIERSLRDGLVNDAWPRGKYGTPNQARGDHTGSVRVPELEGSDAMNIEREGNKLRP